jgi:hypothetical protein
METKEILDERATTYGRYKMVSHISQSIKKTIHESPNYKYMPVYMKESLEMIANKLARILNGDYYHIDSWRDISGYSTLAVIEIEDEAKPDELND